MRPRRNPISKRLGSALVMTLVIIVLITVVTVGYLASVMLETKTATSSLDQERAYGVAMVGVHEAMSRIRDALGPWDDPYRNFFSNAPPFYWSVSPGRLTRFNYGDLTSSNFALFSESSAPEVVNLNRQLGDGSYPIVGGSNALSVRWVNLLPNPMQPASASNAIIGRYAFWVDTEGAKINVNTADGTAKYTTNSLGIGSPTEVSLEVLSQSNGQISPASAQEIVHIARTSNFQSPREILRASAVTPDVFTNNVFSLTAYSRSPELNVFGQPRMSIAPILGTGGGRNGDMKMNSLTLLPPKEIYPSPSQLTNYTVISPYDAEPNKPRTNHPWPMSLRGEIGAYSTGKGEDHRTVMKYYPAEATNYAYHQGYLLAKYLAGTNGTGQAVIWPVFRGPGGTPTTGGFKNKYTPRQLDSMVAQILTIGSKAISADFPYVSGDVGEQIGHRFRIAPYVFPGWLSGQWIIGVGRAMKVTQMRVEVATYPAVGNTPPQASLDFWLEWWLPASYFGGNNVIPPQASFFFIGQRHAKSVLNVIDMPRNFAGPEFHAPLPAASPADPNASPFWGNQLLRNDQGIDFAGNPSYRGNTNTPVLDHDQNMARNFHRPYALIDTNNPASDLKGTGGFPPGVDTDTYFDYASPLILTYLEPLSNPAKEWQPGEMRSIRSQLGPSYQMPMRTNATSLTLSGGIAVKTQFKDGQFSDPDPVPLEAVRGSYQFNGITTQEPFTLSDSDDAGMTDAWFSIDAVPGDSSKGKLRQRIVESVIPVNVNHASLGQVSYVVAKVTDPLVNKFPGDWIITFNSADSTIQPNTSSTVIPKSYPDTSFRSTLKDPDSFWMPMADAGLCDTIAKVASQTLIPRSARMPNIGYLQYLRTGMIPDDESGSYATQHGTPFRLLSFAPSYEASSTDPLVGQQTTRSGSQPYPDWALLDLMYIPSTLVPFGSAYNPATGTPGTNSAVTNLLYYGTYGGATAGKINPNGALIYTTNLSVAEPNISRTLPLQAVLNGVRVNDTLTGDGTNAVFTNGTVVDAASVAQAIENYVRTNGPLRMPAEICNVPAVAALRAPNNPTRNDLVRQIVGALTTQDNVFSVWTVGQAVRKRPDNDQFGQFEAGDNVLAEVRLHFVVERYLDPGADGIYGNPVSAGPDNVVGTYDDPVDATNHPLQPRYLYRVVASEEIR
jgi:hypothetical protein